MHFISKLFRKPKPEPVVEPDKSDIVQIVEWMRKYEMRYQLFRRDDSTGFNLFGGPGNQLGIVKPHDGVWAALLTHAGIHYEDYPSLGEAADKIVSLTETYGR